MNEEMRKKLLSMSDEYYGTDTYFCHCCGVANPDITPDDPYCDVCKIDL